MSNRWLEVISSSQPSYRRWLNRNVVGMAITSFLSDAGHASALARIDPGVLSKNDPSRV